MFLVSVSQKMHVLSSPPEAIILLSGLKIAVLTQFKCPFNSNSNFWFMILYTCRVLSSDPVSKSWPSQEQLTERMGALCALIVIEFPSELLVQSLTVQSLEALAIWLPTGENLTSVTASLWPIYLQTLPVELRFHTKTMLSLEPDTICFLNYYRYTLVDGNESPIFGPYDPQEYLVISDQVRLRSFYLNIQLRLNYKLCPLKIFWLLSVFMPGPGGKIQQYLRDAEVQLQFIFSIFIINFQLQYQNIYNKSLKMIPQNVNRQRKSYSMGLAKEDKENFSNNIQLQAQNGYNKLAKLRESLEQCNQPDKVISSLKVDQKDQNEKIQMNLKKAYSWLVRKDYSASILQTLINRSSDISDALRDHLITNQLRAKMVDWMIQVLSSYKMSEEAFFRSVKYMDIFFKRVSRKLQVSDLHLIGVASMFLASKYQQIYPFKINTIYDKICRKKFAKRQIIDMEQQIISVLVFQLQETTCFDLIQHVLAEIEIPLEPKALEYLHKVSVYLGKMAMHCTQLAWKEDKKLAAAVIYIALKTVQQVQSTLISDNYIQTIAELTKIKTGQLLEMSQELLSLAKNFHKQYPSLTNLKKFNNAEYIQ